MTTSRVQLALNVEDLDTATRFYEQLFGVPAAKQRPGYTNFEIADPPLKLVLFEGDASSPLNHLGVEVVDEAGISAVAERVEAAGLPHRFSDEERCCHAVQTKVWVDAPDVPLNAWEFYVVLADDPTQAVACDAAGCCTDTATSDVPVACCA